MFSLKPFQARAISNLRSEFLRLWKTGGRQLHLVFKSPTGSGKTVMMACFLKSLTRDPQFQADKAFVWVSFSEDSYTQSKSKLWEYYGGAGEIALKDLNDLAEGHLGNNDVFFINWQKIKDSTKEGRKLRRENERGITFDNFIHETQEAMREFVLIVDEAHRDTDTELAQEIVDLINPRIIIRITATPRNEPSHDEIQDGRAGYVRITRDEAVESGLIKEKIITQTKEDIARHAHKELDQDKLLLELAYNKRLELKKLYDLLKLPINPLVLVQLPNDDKARRETLNKTKKEVVLDFLRSKKVEEYEVGIWLADEKKNIETITHNGSRVSFLLFKQAVATGWDCPRASILVMFREIKNPVFHIQTVGRILRMPEAKHYSDSALNIGYLYTNYERNQVLAGFDRVKGANRPAIYGSYRKKGVKQIVLESRFVGRADYNDLGDSFQDTFKTVADERLDIKTHDGKRERLDMLKQQGVVLDNSCVKVNLIVDAEIEHYDNFIEDLKTSGEDMGREISQNDLERTYNLLCFNIIAKQEDENKKFAPERSWGKLKTALNVWFAHTTELDRDEYYRVIVYDLLRPDSILRPIISEAFEKYRPIRAQEVFLKSWRAKRIEKLKIPRDSLFFTDEYEEIAHVKKSAMKPFYIGKKYAGRENELRFVKFLEAVKGIEWWYKNGDYGSEHFSIPYYIGENQNLEKTFYPDWIVKFKNGVIGIFDTKSAMTADAGDTAYKAEALQRWIERQKKIRFIGGIVVEVEQNVWKINRNKKYSHDPSYKEWEVFGEVIK